jgi:ATP-dependent phosphofructokinase / diphosphate-dependent phosphofructokinase
MRIALLTGGGDCPGLNAVIRAAVRRATLDYKWEVLGAEDGFHGLVENEFIEMGPGTVRGLLARGGTILHSSTRGNPFAYPVKLPDGKEEVRDVSERVVANLKSRGVDALVAIGGDGTMSMSRRLGEMGVKVVGVPKTIDNDLSATDYTFGFNTAVQTATEAIDRLQTTAESHNRVMICEIMGRYAGWLTLYSGLAGAADIILIPEMPYDIDKVVAKIKQRAELGISYTIIACSEGAKPIGGQLAVKVKGDATMQEILGGSGDRLAQEIRGRVPFEVRVTVLGHIQRGGQPIPFDRILGTRLGVAAVDLIKRGEFGKIAVLRGTEIKSVTIAEATGQLKLVDPKCELIETARATGTEFGV